MKVLFAVNNENISTQIVKKFQKEYKEIVSYKNMYYFDAIIKELQRDGNYDRIVISEDLEPFSNNNYDAIDKFLFEKLDNISDEAAGNNGKNIPIILISAERRMKGDAILVKYFGIGIYNVLLGQDRNTNNICTLLNVPRTKKEAKSYYQIDSDEIDYKNENEGNVSEEEIKNILNHYKRLGKDEERYVESFNNIVAQYNDTQLRIITKYLPLNVKAVLEEKSQKYQSIMTFNSNTSNINEKKEKDDGLKIGFLKDDNNKKISGPVIVPKAIKKIATKQNKNINAVTDEKVKIQEKNLENVKINMQQEEKFSNIDFEDVDIKTDLEDNDINNVTELNEKIEDNTITFGSISEEIPEVEVPVKKGRGRPKKVLTQEEIEAKANVVKRGRGRPKKVNTEKESIEDDDTVASLPGFDDYLTEENKETQTLPGFDEEDDEEDDDLFSDITDSNTNTELPGFDQIDDDENDDLFSYITNNNTNTELPGFDQIEDDSNLFSTSTSTSNNTEYSNYTESNAIDNYSKQQNVRKFSGIISKDKKVVSFVGTTKNGTSFLVNNLGKCLSTMGIKTAILDLTINRNSYYVYTNNDEKLRNIALESIKKLKSGITSGIVIDKFLDVYTALPGEIVDFSDVDGIISTLSQNYSVVLMDCDFNTIPEYFAASQEIYIVQTMDILTIQPMTAFLRDLKAKDILEPEKVKIVINKEIKVRGLTEKAIIGGLSSYNDPAMAFMTKLFDKEAVKYCSIPFEEENCAKYLEGVMDCSITINGYTKNFNMKLKELAGMVYPLIGNKYRNIGDYSSNNKFSASMNNTLEQMKNKY